MPMTDAARNVVADLIIGAGNPYNSTGAYIGVGDSTTAFAVTQTDLQGANKHREAMKTGFPTRTTNTISFESRFEEADAVYTWNEVGLFNDASSGTMLTRILASQGLKPNDEIWDYEIQLTILHGSE